MLLTVADRLIVNAARETIICEGDRASIDSRTIVKYCSCLCWNSFWSSTLFIQIEWENTRCHQRNYELHIDERDRKPDYVHPVVRRHPITQKRSIFINWTHTDKILDMEVKNTLSTVRFSFNKPFSTSARCNKIEKK